jgi:hypothetical protein
MALEATSGYNDKSMGEPVWAWAAKSTAKTSAKIAIRTPIFLLVLFIFALRLSISTFHQGLDPNPIDSQALLAYRFALNRHSNRLN